MKTETQGEDEESEPRGKAWGAWREEENEGKDEGALGPGRRPPSVH